MNSEGCGRRRDRKHAGIQPGTVEQASQWMAIGFNVVSWASDVAVYRAALAAGVSQIRELAGTSAARGA